jgi:omega-amidase
MPSLQVALVQYNIAFENKAANFSKILEAIKDVDCDLVVLPEAFQTGCCVGETWMAEEMDGETMTFLKELSSSKNAAVCGSFFCMEGRSCFNRFVVVKEGEVIAKYDKIHLFKMGDEDKSITAGTQTIDFELNGFKIRPVVCYDIRFPYVCYNDTMYDVLVCSANWPSQRIEHWDTLLKARAIENQSFVLGCNRIGEYKDMFYPGHSSVYSPIGERVAFSYKKDVVLYELTKEVIEETRSKLPFISDQVIT